VFGRCSTNTYLTQGIVSQSIGRLEVGVSSFFAKTLFFAERPLSFCGKGWENLREVHRAKNAACGGKSISLGREQNFSGQGAKKGEMSMSAT